jgi:hypothetical protein
MYTHDSGPAEKTKLLKAIARQHYMQEKIWSSPIEGALSLDVANSNNLTLRTFVMGMKRDGTDKDLFADCNPSWDGMSVNAFYSAKFSREASFKVKNMAAFTYWQLGQAGLEWFSLDMQAVVDMGWDEERNCLISASEAKLDKALEIRIQTPRLVRCSTFLRWNQWVRAPRLWKPTQHMMAMLAQMPIQCTMVTLPPQPQMHLVL